MKRTDLGKFVLRIPAMNYAQQQRSLGKHFVAIGLVIVFHILLVWALVSGPARKGVEVSKPPLETRIIEEVKPPRKDTPPLLPPTFAPPPLPFIPPPEISVQAPVNTANTVSAVTKVEPVAAPPPTPSPPPTPVEKPAASNAIGAACPDATRMMAHIPYPRNALRDGITGSFIIEFTVAADGAIKDPTVIGRGHKSLTDAAKNAVMQLKCVAQGQDVKVQAPFSFKLE